MLRQRIHERFPESGLGRVALELETIARETQKRVAAISRPNLGLRLVTIILVLILLAIIALFIRGIQPDTVQRHLSDAFDVAQFAESTLATIVFLGAALIFLVTFENRLKRGRALDAIYELRSLAHVVDMHQLTKDPERIMSSGPRTRSSPEKTMTPFELNRYLDYSSELLSLISKVAVLYVQGIKDDDVLQAVDQIESLTTGLSRKIWQKITLLERMMARTPDRRPANP